MQFFSQQIDKRGKGRKEQVFLGYWKLYTLNYYLQGYTFMQLLWRAIWNFFQNSKCAQIAGINQSAGVSSGKAPLPKHKESHCSVTMSKHQKQPKCLLWGTHCEHWGMFITKKYYTSAKKIELFLYGLKWIHSWMEKERTAEWHMYNNLNV